jgi:glutamyl-tRNA synthetase
MQKLPFLQDKHLERLVDKEIKTVREALQLERDFLSPLKAAIDRVQQGKDAGKVLLPGKIGAAEIGARLPAARILDEERFHGHLGRLVLGTKLQLQEHPADRFVNALWKLRYYIWEVPEGVLEMAVRDGELEPVVPADRAEKLAAAVAILADKFAAVDEAGWDHDGLASVMKDAMADQRYWACFETTNAQTNLYTPLRWALLGLEKGLPVSTTMEILGREETLRRLRVARIAAEKAAVPMPESIPQNDRW